MNHSTEELKLNDKKVPNNDFECNENHKKQMSQDIRAKVCIFFFSASQSTSPLGAIWLSFRLRFMVEESPMLCHAIVDWIKMQAKEGFRYRACIDNQCFPWWYIRIWSEMETTRSLVIHRCGVFLFTLENLDRCITCCRRNSTHSSIIEFNDNKCVNWCSELRDVIETDCVHGFCRDSIMRCVCELTV